MTAKGSTKRVTEESKKRPQKIFKLKVVIIKREI